MFGRKSVKTESEQEVKDPTADPTVRDIAHIRNYAHKLRLAAEAEEAVQGGDPSEAELSAEEPDADIEEVTGVKVVNTTESAEADDSVADPMPATPEPHDLVDMPPALIRATASVVQMARDTAEKPAGDNKHSARPAPGQSRQAAASRPASRDEDHKATSHMSTTQTSSRPRQSIAPALESTQPVTSQPMYVARPEPVNAADSNESLRLAQVGVGTVGGIEDGDEALSVRNISIQGVTFRAPRSISPGTIRQMKMDTERATLASKIRVVSCKLRGDGSFDIKAEFF